MIQTRIQYLLKQFQDGQLTKVETEELFELTTSENKTMLEGALNALIVKESATPEFEEKVTIDATFYKIMAMDKPTLSVESKREAQQLPSIASSQTQVLSIHFLKTIWLRYAAVLLLIAGTGTFLYLNNRPQKEILSQTKDEEKKLKNLLQGGNKAILTLADGRTILLDSVANGTLTEQGNMRIVKLANGQVRYEVAQPMQEDKGKGQSEEQPITYNTIITPKGGQYQVELQDGSKVWLNAASSIKFPTAFTSKERKIEVSGEVYLEVAKKMNAPFSVSTGNTVIQVLGTEFNINAYPDEENQRTTLISGAVKVLFNQHQAILQPGEAADIKEGIRVSTVNVEQAMAWKKGFFNIEGASLPAVMRQLSRWYDVEVIYEGNVPEKIFQGKLSRNVPLVDVMEWFTALGIPNRLQGRRLILTAE